MDWLTVRKCSFWLIYAAITVALARWGAALGGVKAPFATLTTVDLILTGLGLSGLLAYALGRLFGGAPAAH